MLAKNVFYSKQWIHRMRCQQLASTVSEARQKQPDETNSDVLVKIRRSLGFKSSTFSGGSGGRKSGHAPPIQSDSLTINFECDIRPREVRPSVSCFLSLH